MQTILSRKLSSKVSGRRANILVLSAAFMVSMLGFLAFTVDIGFIALARGQLQSAVDAATLAGAMELNPNGNQVDVVTRVRAACVTVAALNKVGVQPGLILDPLVDVELGSQVWDSGNQVYTQQFGVNAAPYNIVKVTGRLNQTTIGGVSVDRRLPLFFAPVLGVQSTAMESRSVGTYVPRDIMLALDYSGSMNDDTEYKSIPSLGQTMVTDAITTMWTELGSPVYGSMPFTPAFLTKGGVAASGTIPHIDVTFKGKSVVVSSSMNLTTVKLKFSNDNIQTFSGLSGMTGTFQGSGSNGNKRINYVWVQSGTNANLSSEGWGEKSLFTDNDIKTHLGLTTYPHPNGSWLEFIDEVNTASSVNTAGFRYKYGTMSLINYWMENYPSNADSPGMWVCSSQPLTALKNSADFMIDYLKEADVDDRLGLAIYSHSNTDGAILETGLLVDLDAVKPFYRQRQAGHYLGGTNIGAGMYLARLELQAHARANAFRMMVVMTDGLPNLPVSSSVATQYVRDEATACKAAKIRIMTISVGLYADTSLMQEIADTTGGLHFNVPGGATFAEYQANLEIAFHKIAAHRPLKLLPEL